MPTREDFNAQVSAAIAGRLDPEYVNVRLQAEKFDAFGEEVTLTLPNSKPLTGLSTALARQATDKMVQDAPEALRTTPRDFEAAREKARELNRQGELTESARKAREKLYAGGSRDTSKTSDAVASRLGL